MNQILPIEPGATFLPVMFSGRTFLVTGAGRGIGKVLARRVAALGGQVGVCDLVEARAQEAAAGIAQAGGSVVAIPADVSREADVARMVDTVIQRFGRIDVLANTAGSYGAAYRVTHETPVEEWDSVFASNVRGSFLCAKAVLPHMISAGGGRIINFASNAGRSVSPLLGCS